MQNYSNHMDKIEMSKIRMIGDKASQMAAEGRSIVKLQVGEPDFNTPKHIVDAAIRALENMDTHYTPNRGTMNLRRAIADKLLRDNGIKADPAKNIMVMTGCAEALLCAILGLLDPGDEMIIIEPTFINYMQLTKLAGAVPVIVRAREEYGWLPDPEDIKKAITPRTKMLLLNTPSNPTGAVYPKELIGEIAALAVEHDFFVVSDEVYEKLIYSGEHVSIASLPGMEDRAITINGLSKAYAMTGWRVGYLCASEHIIIPMLKIHQYATTCSPGFIQAACIDALYNSDDDVNAMQRVYQARRNLLCAELSSSDRLSFIAPDGTFYLYVNISETGLDSETFVMRLLEEKGVATVFGTAFDHTLGSQNIRLSFANSEENLREGARRIVEFVESL